MSKPHGSCATCDKPATGWLYASNGNSVLGPPSCEPCAQGIVAAYREVLGWEWHYVPGTLFDGHLLLTPEEGAKVLAAQPERALEVNSHEGREDHG